MTVETNSRGTLAEPARAEEALAAENTGGARADRSGQSEAREQPPVQTRHSPERAAVLFAVGVACRVHRRAVCAREVTEALTSEAIAALSADLFGMPLTQYVARILGRLWSGEKALESPGKVGADRYYAVLGAGAAKTVAMLPANVSRRQRSLALVREAAKVAGRAVRFVDVVAHQALAGWANDIDRAGLGRDIQSLVRAGDLVIAREVLGGGADGKYFYLPVDLDHKIPMALPVPPGPTSWLEHVLEVFTGCWAREVDAASGEDRRPRPLATEAVRAALRAAGGWPQADDERLVPNAMLQLARATPPRVRQVMKRAGSHFAVWAPSSVSDEALDLDDAYPSDAARMAAATRRACVRRHALAVPRAEIEVEVANDPQLRPTGNRTIAEVLADVSKPLVSDGKGGRQERRDPVVIGVGHLDGHAYYSVEDRQQSEQFVEWLRLTRAWESLDVPAELRQANESGSPVARLGRVRLVADEIGAIAQALDVWRQHSATAMASWAQTIDHVSELLKAAYGLVQEEAARHIAAARQLTSWDDMWSETWAVPPCLEDAVLACSDARLEVIDGITAHELLPIVRGRYPKAATITDPIALVPLLARRIGRVRNPEFRGWRRESPEFLFDRAEALMVSTFAWGGQAAVLYAHLARPELGALRDAQWVRPGLKHPNYTVRMASAAALGFLRPDDATVTALHQIALGDVDGGVRRAAIWSLFALDIAAAREVASLMLEDEPNAVTAQLAQDMLELPADQRWNR